LRGSLKGRKREELETKNPRKYKWPRTKKTEGKPESIERRREKKGTQIEKRRETAQKKGNCGRGGKSTGKKLAGPPRR